MKYVSVPHKTGAKNAFIIEIFAFVFLRIVMRFKATITKNPTKLETALPRIFISLLVTRI